MLYKENNKIKENISGRSNSNVKNAFMIQEHPKILNITWSLDFNQINKIIYMMLKDGKVFILKIFLKLIQVEMFVMLKIAIQKITNFLFLAFLVLKIKLGMAVILKVKNSYAAWIVLYFGLRYLKNTSEEFFVLMKVEIVVSTTTFQ